MDIRRVVPLNRISVYAVFRLVYPFSNVNLLPLKLHSQQRNQRNDAAA